MYLIKILKLKILVITYGLILQILRTTCLLQTLCIVRYFIELKVLMSVSSHTHTHIHTQKHEKISIACAVSVCFFFFTMFYLPSLGYVVWHSRRWLS